MPKIPFFKALPGMTIEKSIIDKYGFILLTQFQTLSVPILRRLREHNIQEIEVLEETKKLEKSEWIHFLQELKDEEIEYLFPFEIFLTQVWEEIVSILLEILSNSLSLFYKAVFLIKNLFSYEKTFHLFEQQKIESIPKEVLSGIIKRIKEELKEPLIKLLKHQNPKLRILTISLLSEWQETEILNILKDYLQDNDTEVAFACALSLEKSFSDSVISTLIRVIEDKSFKEASKAVLALERVFKLTNDERIIAALFRFIKDERASIRRCCAYVLGEMKISEAVPLIIPLVYEKNDLNRAYACRSLGQIRNILGIDALVHALDDPQEYVQEISKESIIKFQDESIPFLLEYFKKVPWWKRDNVIEILGKIKTPKSKELLLEISQTDENLSIRKKATYLLSES